MHDLTISDLKRALVEVKRICATREFCNKPDICPFSRDTTGLCSLDHSYPEYWETVDWKENSDETD